MDPKFYNNLKFAITETAFRKGKSKFVAVSFGKRGGDKAADENKGGKKGGGTFSGPTWQK